MQFFLRWQMYFQIIDHDWDKLKTLPQLNHQNGFEKINILRTEGAGYPL